MNVNPVIEPVIEEVRKTAYLIYQANGCASGNDLENWLAAQEKIVTRRPYIGEKMQYSSTAQLHFPLNANVSRAPFEKINLFENHN